MSLLTERLRSYRTAGVPLAHPKICDEAADRIDYLEAAMGEFCDRVERGEVRSRRTYARYCDLLGRKPKA